MKATTARSRCCCSGRHLRPCAEDHRQIVHDIDLNDGKFGHPETAGIAHVIAGICRTQGDDEARRGSAARELFDDIYEQFRRRKEK